ncbi:hypothetical protein J5N97_027232 [Dioscorea zingiberensis]|uniref:BCAS3 domain-containing protein n=1 Tax=Dioscorea zingiberensis TaxID=325984 RepID=A0A9D5H7F3_9LILI|nr:hypothetical protein J5N97_027232 [Dioscorea zingiberensis]
MVQIPHRIDEGAKDRAFVGIFEGFVDWGMRNDVQRPQGAASRGGKGNGIFSLRNISNYLRIVSSGASTVASSVRATGASVASSIAGDDDANRDQVHWAGFDKLECEGDVPRLVLLLGYRSGFQVWDVEEVDDVRQLVSRHEGFVSFLQMQKNPIPTKVSEDRFSDFRPLLVVVGDGSPSGNCNSTDGMMLHGVGSVSNCQDLGNENLVPTFVRFYSLRTHEYVHVLKFRSAVYSVRCSPRVVAVSLASQIHCFHAATLEREYTILTFPIVPGSLGVSSIGYGPLAVGSRWLAYSGNPVAVSDTLRVPPQDVNPTTGLPASLPNGSLMAHYAKESSKQLAAGIVILGDLGYKKLSKYYSDLTSDGNNSLKQGNPTSRTGGAINGNFPDAENIGMVIVRDIVSKNVVVQFRAHRSPISALCFDPSGTLLVTASIHGHNINVFRVMPSPYGSSSGIDTTGTCVHLYRLQRGITNAVIQDISFSNDSQWIMISSSRGTSHLFAISPFGGTPNCQFNDFKHGNNGYGSDLTSKAVVSRPNGTYQSKATQQNLYASGPVTLSVVSRIKNGSNGWKGAVTGAAAAATGRVNPLSGAIASTFHYCKKSGHYADVCASRTKYNLLVFSPSGSIIQYALRESNGEDSGLDLSGISTASHVPVPETDTGFVVEALQKWDVCHKRNRRDRGDTFDVYGEHGNVENMKFFQKGIRKGNIVYPANTASDTRVKPITEENHHLYFSEAELQMHSPFMPLWAKSGICFQVMKDENSTTDIGGDLGGEIEIEKISTLPIETRSKDLVPVFDYYQTPRFPQSRSHPSSNERNGTFLGQKSGFSDDSGRHSRRSSCSSLEVTSEVAAVADMPNVFNENSFGGLRATTEANEDFVNNMNKSNINRPLEFVNNRECLKTEAQLEHVNNIESLNMETDFVDHDDQLDYLR